MGETERVGQKKRKRKGERARERDRERKCVYVCGGVEIGKVSDKHVYKH